jgi:ABC-2 type transport system ATP-binding protein
MINIKANGLGHFYGQFQALKDVTFDIEQGTVVGLVGPNGAGKTTTMKILTGCLVPSLGSATVGGHDIVADRLAAQRHIGYLPEAAPLYRDMLVQDYLLFMARLRSVAAADRLRRVGAVVDACDLRSVLTKPIGHLSKGFRQRVGLAQALVHDPSILILDEPTSGLDPNQILEIRALIRGLGEKKTVVLSTHILSEVEAICSRAIVIVSGRVHADEDLAHIGAVNAAIVGIAQAPADARDRMRALPGVRSVEPLAAGGPGRARFRVIGDGSTKILDQVGKLASDARWTLAELTPERRDLEDIFRNLSHDEGGAVHAKALAEEGATA